MTQQPGPLDTVHHVAISVDDVGASVKFYTENFRCQVRYQDETWALLEFQNMQLALVIPAQHPPHIALASHEAVRFGPLKLHRDQTRSTYIRDPAGNTIEVLDMDQTGNIYFA